MLPSPFADAAADVRVVKRYPLGFVIRPVPIPDPVPALPDVIVLLVPEVVLAVHDVPEVPLVPAVHEVPLVPAVPAVPLVPEVPAVPLVPEVPDVPDVPDVPEVVVAVPAVAEVPVPHVVVGGVMTLLWRKRSFAESFLR